MKDSLGLTHVSLVAALLLGSCGGDKAKKPSEDPEAAATRRAMLANVTDRVLVPTLEGFASDAGALSKACAAYAKSVSDEDRLSAQSAFKKAMRTWEIAEVMQVGPAAPATVPGGKGLRDEIYAWPYLNLCGVDRALVDESYEQLSDLFTNSRGLGVLEVLLFDEWTETRCLSNDTVATKAAFQELVAGDFAKRRAAYAARAAAHVKKTADALLDAWKSGFASELKKAGDGSETYASTQEALNALSDALFYVDTETKDMKVAVPAGISDSCLAPPCTDRVEHPYAKVSKESILANLAGFRDVFLGRRPDSDKSKRPFGFSDLLASMSQGDLATEMEKLLEDTISAFEAIDGSFEDSVASEDKQVTAAYAKLQDLMTRFKSDFVAALGLSKPVSAASDQD